MSYELKIDPKKRAGSRFIGKVRREIVLALLEEKKVSGLNQQKLANALGVNRSVVSRMLKGETNLTLRSIGEIAWAMGWEPEFHLNRKPDLKFTNRTPVTTNPVSPATGTTRQNVAVYSPPVSHTRLLNNVEAAE